MITIRKIAEVSGFSKSSVWMALNQHPKQSKKTREQIMAVARELGYRPNPAYRTMLQQVRSGRPIKYRSTLGLLNGLPFPDPESRIPFHRDLVEGFIERATQFGYEVDKFWLNQPNMSEKRLGSILSSRGIQGIMVAPFERHRKLEMNLDSFATIPVGFTMLNPDLNRVEFNNQEATALCIRKLYEDGYERIGFVHRADYETWREYNLLAPYLWHVSKFPRQNRAEVFFAHQDSRNEFIKWFKGGKFDSLIINYEHVVEWLADDGIHSPQDVGLVFPTPTHAHLDFTHVNHHPQKLGAASADALIAQLQRGEYGRPSNPRTVTTDVSWWQGKSTRRVGPPKRTFNLRVS